MATNEERRAATRAKLIQAGREHFARDGYDGAHTSRILEQAGVSRGAMYHHFKNKQELFEAVFIAVSDETIESAANRLNGGASPLEDLISASLAWLKAVQQPELAAILLDQAPQVLGWKHARDLEAQTSLELMTKSLERAVKAKEIQVPSVALAARLINALLAETALVALYEEPPTSFAKQEAAIRQFIEGLKP